MNGDLTNLLGGANIEQRVPVRRLTTLTLAQISFEKDAEGAVQMHVDVVWGPAGAERYTIPFDAESFDGFLMAAQNAGTDIAIAKPKLIQ